MVLSHGSHLGVLLACRASFGRCRAGPKILPNKPPGDASGTGPRAGSGGLERLALTRCCGKTDGEQGTCTAQDKGRQGKRSVLIVCAEAPV